MVKHKEELTHVAIKFYAMEWRFGFFGKMGSCSKCYVYMHACMYIYMPLHMLSEKCYVKNL